MVTYSGNELINDNSLCIAAPGFAASIEYMTLGRSHILNRHINTKTPLETPYWQEGGLGDSPEGTPHW